LLSIVLILAVIIQVSGQPEIKLPAVRDSISIKYPIIFFEDTVGYLSSTIGAFTAEERSERINRRLSVLLKADQFDTTTLSIQIEDQKVIIIHNKEILGIITATDTKADSLDQSQIAVTLIANLKKSHLANYASFTLFANLIRTGMLLGILIGLFLMVRLLNLGFNRLIEWILNKWQDYFSGIKIKNYQFLTKEK